MSSNIEFNIAPVKLGFYDNLIDPRTKSWPLAGHPGPVLAIMTAYVLFVTKIGPRLMANRKPFELRTPMLIYNIFMVVINAFFFITAAQWLNYGKELLNLSLPPVEDTSEKTMSHLWLFYLYWLTKFVDLLDTVFFVLRKKQNQITTLHLYHHTVVPILGWLGIWFRCTVPGISLFAFLNSAVHVVMYSYYALSAFGPKIQPYLWWKKYITQIQLIQFVLLGLYGAFVGPHLVGYPREAYWIAMSQPPLFFYMFYDFYRQCYKNKKGSEERKRIEETLEKNIEKLLN